MSFFNSKKYFLINTAEKSDISVRNDHYPSWVSISKAPEIQIQLCCKSKIPVKD